MNAEVPELTMCAQLVSRANWNLQQGSYSNQLWYSTDSVKLELTNLAESKLTTGVPSNSVYILHSSALICQSKRNIKWMQ